MTFSYIHVNLVLKLLFVWFWSRLSNNIANTCINLYIYTKSFTMIFRFKIGTYKEFFHSAPWFVDFRYKHKMTYIYICFFFFKLSIVLSLLLLTKAHWPHFRKKKINISQINVKLSRINAYVPRYNANLSQINANLSQYNANFSHINA